MIRKLLVVLPMAISTAAFAADNSGSEYFHQAAAGAWEVTPGIDYHDYTAKMGSGSKTTVSGMAYGVKGEYGINDMFSAGIMLSAGNDKYKPDSGSSQTASGLNNIDIYGLGKYDLGGSTLRYGLDFAVSTAKLKLDANTSLPSNEDLGGTMMTPFVGWEAAMGPGILGAKFSYSFGLTDRTIDNGGTTEHQKGVNAESLSAFYEWQAASNWNLGLSLAWNSVNGSTITGTQEFTGHAGLFVDVYAPITVADNITIIPNVGWGDDGSTDYFGTGINTVQKWNVGVGARFAF